MVETYPGDVRWLDNGLLLEDSDGDGTNEEIAYRLTLNTLPTSRVDAVVNDDHGGSIEGAVVQLWSQNGLGSAKAVTGHDGHFVEFLPEGTWSVTIEGPEGGPFPSGQQQEPLEVEGRGVTAVFELARGVVFSGWIETSRGEMAADIGFNLVDSDQGEYRWGQSEEDGTFSMAVFPGDYSIHIYAGSTYPSQPVIENVVIDSDTSGYVIMLDAGFAVSGSLLDADKRPLEATRVTFYGENFTRTVLTGDSGEFSLNLVGGTYWAEVRPDNARLVPYQSAGPFGIAADTQFDINLERGGVIAGSVYDDRGNPVPHAQVNIYAVSGGESPWDPADSLYNSDDAAIYFDEDGQATYPDLVDGSAGQGGKRTNYYQLATDENGQWSLALLAGTYGVDVAAPYPYPSQRVKLGTFAITDGGQVDAGRAEIAYGVLFSGTVKMDASKPFVWSGFYLYDADNSGNQRWISTGEKGEFSVQVVPGEYDLLFNPTGGYEFPRQWVRGVSLTSDTQQEFVLEGGHVVSGRVTSEDGEVLTDCRLYFYENNGDWRVTVATGQDGGYSICLLDGNYNVVVSPAKGFFADSSYYTIAVDGDTSFEPVLLRGISVSGQVTATDGHPLGAVQIMLIQPGSWSDADTVIEINRKIASFASYSLDSLDGSDEAQDTVNGIAPDYPSPVDDYSYSTRSNADGQWEVVVRPGVYDILATPLFTGFANTFLPDVDCSQERTVDIVLDDVEIVFEGTVTDRDGDPASNALVSLFDPDGGDHVSAFTDEAGRFSIDLPVGDYEMFVEGEDQSVVAETLKLSTDSDVKIQLGFGLLKDETPTYKAAKGVRP